MDTAALWEAGRAAWPAIALSQEAFAARVDGDDVRAADLYLAVACERGDPSALKAFEETCIAGVRPLLARYERDAGRLDDLIQRVRTRILVGDGETPPRLATYTGRGSLAGWVKVLATRLATNGRRDQARAKEQVSPDGAVSVVDRAPSPDQLLLGQQHGPALRDGLRAALAGLPRRSRALLRMHYVEGVPLDRIGVMYAVNKSTISRWLAAAREQILDRVIASVRDAAGLATEEIESVCAVLVSALDVSLSVLESASGTSS